jgi:hypothetical protein
MAGDSRANCKPKVAAVSHFIVRLTVPSVLLECPAQECDFLAGDRVEESLDHLACEARLLVLVHLNHSVPISGDVMQMKRFGKVDEVENILLEARTTETLQTLSAASSPSP